MSGGREKKRKTFEKEKGRESMVEVRVQRGKKFEVSHLRQTPLNYQDFMQQWGVERLVQDKMNSNLQSVA